MPASAATIINFNGTVGTLTAGQSLANDAGTYTSGTTPYIFLEKTIVNGLTTQQIFLFHFDSPGNNGGDVAGTFQIKLDAGSNVVSILPNSLSALDAQDAQYGVAGVSYPTGTAGRGLEGNDSFSLGALANNLQTISYNLRGNGNNIDEVRFSVARTAAVPEPATWGMMIVGIGLAGGALRRRQRRTVAYDLA
ncbi:PEPxxWA-CTERM sorting domain-containing protein [Novosphingobium sp. G106]|nr:PEPxxWA-CTERM sorting domain-containing protein [Novosphingobium sp. G106]